VTHPQLDNLVRIGQLKAEPPAESEIAGLIRSGLARLCDAERAELSLENRFDLASPSWELRPGGVMGYHPTA